MRYYKGASVYLVDHHGTAQGNEWALRSKSVTYQWALKGSKEGVVSFLQYTRQQAKN